MKWIKVEDKLPNKFQDVLTLNKSKFMHVCWFGVNEFYYKSGCVSDGHRTITHWMRLPRLPKD